ncbi:putative Leptomycin B resistance protein pmd1 [Ceraceosorus guamensis]|uniref:Putative Leptomycin B resistance protein pmd1 n=1 Tax=Ceraceosorus guamensis TaxID=1522189 RepID=A0A316W0R5_9BASI|nr:putative Leptomycin B resistance protein pmd1 [Ceraceosorus guamensis]PWN43517.1 putative Leptomycin B resistance protein pmd1 [Ceraceosorus guamensis]
MLPDDEKAGINSYDQPYDSANQTPSRASPPHHGKLESDNSDGRSQHSVLSGDQDSTLETPPYKATTGDLFRFATKFELFLNFLGLIAACGAGVAQPLMTVVFGNLTTSFLDYTNQLGRDPTLPGAMEAMQRARDELRDAVGRDALLLLYIGIAMFGATYLYMATWMYTGETITGRIRQNYLAAVMRQEIAYFDLVGAGEITSRIQSDIQLIQEGISDKVPMSFMFLATFVAGFAVAFAKSWLLALVMSSIVPCIIAAGALMNVLATKHQQTELDYVSHAATVAEEAMSTVRTAKAFGIEQRLVDLYDEYNVPTSRTGRAKAVINGVGMGVFFFVIYSSYALAFWEGSRLIASGTIETGVVMNVVFSILMGAFSMAMLAPNAQAWAYGIASAGKIFETIDRVPEIDSASDSGARPTRCDGEIEVCNVDFRYPARREVPILENFSVQIPRGKITALVGASGSGKSTIVSLVERFYDPESGAVFLDGRDLRDLNLKWLRTQIGLVSQEPTLFATTIRQNIGFGLLNTVWEKADQEKKDELIIEAAKQANAHAFIQQLPDGYETMVGERGFLLSGGQKQRVAIARAIVKNPRILLLDEATSALDTQSEGIVQDALDKASKGRTTITIAHRLSTIKNADNIVVMGKGTILETGTHDELLRRPDGAYSSLVSAQKIRANTSSAHVYEDEEEELEELRRRALAAQVEGLGRSKSRQSIHSITSAILRRRKEEHEGEKPRQYSLFYLLYRLAVINKGHILSLYVPGFIGSFLSGAVYPAFSILFGIALQNFSKCSNLGGEACPEPARSDMRHQANLNALYFFIISILSTFAIAIQNHHLMMASSYLMERVRRLSLLAYLRADVSYFDEDGHASGVLTASLSDNAQKINGLVGVTMGTIFQSVATLIVGYIIGLIYGWKLALVCISVTPLTLSAGFIRLELVVLKDAKIKKAHEGAAQRACEAAASIRTVAALTSEGHFQAVYKEELRGPAKITHRAALYSTIFYAISQALAFGVIALAFWYGSGLLLDGEISSGHFFTVLTSVIFGSIQAGNVFNFVPDISNARSAADDTIRLLDMKPEIDSESTEGIILDKCEGRVQFEKVHFRYPTRPGVRVLAGIDLDIKPGTYCALVGGSGCGKSTTIQLIERFYDAVSGRVLIDGHDITDLNLKSLRKHVALVSQEPTLYDGTIAYNLRLGAFEDADQVTDQQLQRAAAQANILNFIESLPNGFETEVGGKGTQLSGGQKQRIAIARALIRDPKILLLDEATSALDSESERVVQDALDRAARGRTTIAIAHRLSTISRSDRIFVLQNGIVAEQGEHSSLMRLGGLYSQLVSLQELQRDE